MKKTGRLELTWVGKYEEKIIEPRILLEDVSKTYGNPDNGNMLIHGDNLIALQALQQDYAGKIKCIYIDPPYNTGSAFEYYDDGLEHSEWLQMMHPRLQLLRNLLSDDGSIWIQIDDEEQAYLKVMCDEIFGRANFVNMISVNMKNIAGASGGGEDRRLKKNCEYILIYAKNYDLLDTFRAAYDYEEISELVERYKEEGISWKYTSVFLDEGEKRYIASTVDGDGNEIKIFEHTNYVLKSIGAVAKDEGITEKDVYYRYAGRIIRTTMPQSSIRPRVMKRLQEMGYSNDLISIEYVPKTGKNKGTVYTQYYKGDKYNLFAWLSDVLEERDGVYYKKTMQGTYWDYTAGTKNLTKEGKVEFPNGKKPEALISRIFSMTTIEGDYVLDSFLGSGTTAAVAQKMNRKWIGIEMGDHAYSHCKYRLDKVIDGSDKGGISKTIGWQGGGGYRFFELAPSLINCDPFDEYVINEEYNADMLAAAVALHEGFRYQPDGSLFWKQSVGNESSYLFVTTRHLNSTYLDSIKDTMEDGEYLIIACRSFDSGLDKAYGNITIKKIPQMLLSRCEFGKADYNLNIVHPPVYDDEWDEEDCDE